MRTSPTSGTTPQTIPAPTATLRRHVAADCPVPSTVATTWLLRGSTRKTSQRAAQTASGPAAIALISSHGGSRTRRGSGILATIGDAAVSGPAGCVAGTPTARRLPLVRRPTTTKAVTTVAIPTTVNSGVPDERGSGGHGRWARRTRDQRPLTMARSYGPLRASASRRVGRSPVARASTTQCPAGLFGVPERERGLDEAAWVRACG